MIYELIFPLIELIEKICKLYLSLKFIKNLIDLQNALENGFMFVI